MEYFATLNQMHGSIDIDFFKAIHYDFWAGLLMIILLGCLIALLAIKMDYSPRLNRIEQAKIYGRAYDED